MSESSRCQHHRINNDTGRCVECGDQMITQHWEADTVLSAPNAAACTNPACKAALEDGTYDETDPPAGCTNPHGFYIADTARQRTITIGYNVTYECDRCANDGTCYTSDFISWDCGHHHRGDYILAKSEAAAVGGSCGD